MIIEGQNFDIRRTLWRYSALVDEQRRSVYARRQELLRDEIEPAFCEEKAPDHYEKLESMIGPQALRHSENLLTMHLLDRHWSDHLALIEDIREGIHLQHYCGRQPLDEFHKQIVEAFAAMMEDIRSEAVAVFRGLSADGGTVNLEQAGFRGPSSTWTYLVNDNPCSSFGVSLLASRNIGFSYAAGMLAARYLPITFAISASVLLRRWLRRRQSG
jgi:preprotein translocase subunit SecA